MAEAACPLLLYSVNSAIKLTIQQMFRGDIHWVWCSEQFDSHAADRYSISATVAPTSNPAAIYRQLKEESAAMDRHSDKIEKVRVSLSALAVKWQEQGEISAEEKEEIISLVKYAGAREWRPLLYVIPGEGVKGRIKRVRLEERAGVGPEYIIEDLKPSEFHIIEL